MKKSFLALSAAAVIGGLGLATSAQAVYFFNNGVNPDSPVSPTNKSGPDASVFSGAKTLQLNPGAIGHELIVPYYSAQGSTSTMLSIVNTDQVNGKAVKVRFRGAANSDDVLDFTVLLSPADVWTASISQGADGLAHLSSSDTSCTIPTNNLFGDVPFRTGRLASYLTGSQAAANTREGYVEILNMADIPPAVWDSFDTNPAVTDNALYLAIKHSNGTPSCKQTWATGANKNKDAIVVAENTALTSAVRAYDSYGLAAPTGGLTGSWILLNQSTLAQYSGTAVAVQALDGTGGASTSTNIVFSPQLEDLAPSQYVALQTADPLLTGYATQQPKVQAQYMDLPDLSSPFAGTTGLSTNVTDLSSPTSQAYVLAAALGHFSVLNEYINDPAGAATGVPMSTDWIISQPTRRYFAVVDYSNTSAAESTIIYNDGWTSFNNDPAAQSVNSSTTNPRANIGVNLPYAGQNGIAHASWPTQANARNELVGPSLPGSVVVGSTGASSGQGILTLQQQGTYGPVACLSSKLSAVYDREETAPTAGWQFSPLPNTSSFYCGEVATATWGNSPVGAALTNTKASGSFTSGWAVFMPSTPITDTGNTTGLPFTGYAAEAGGNGNTGVTFGGTFQHRW